GDDVDVGVDEDRIPVDGVGHAIDVVPAAGVEADEVGGEGGPNLHQLEAGLDLLDEDVDLDGADRDAQLLLQHGQNVVPQGGLFGRLDLRQVQHHRRSVASQLQVVVHDVEDRVDDGGGEPGAVLVADVAVVEVQAAGAEDLSGERELPPPVLDDG